MKKSLMAMAMVVITSFALMADTETIGGYTWSYRINGDGAEIYDGYFAAISPIPSGAVTIPSTLGGRPVTSIGEGAFYGCAGLTSVTIPDSVTSIGDGAFEDCDSLTSVTIPNSVTNIGEDAFWGCRALASVTIPDGVTRIGNYAFGDCSSLSNVIISASVVHIGHGVFTYCVALDRLVVADDNPSYKVVSGLLLTKDGTTLVQGFNGDVVIPDGVMIIGDFAFWNCDALTSVVMPDSVTHIGQSAFSWCESLPEVVIPGNVTNLGQRAFGSCRALTNVTIPDSVTSIGQRAFSDCRGLTSVTIGNGVTSIGEWAFWCCYGLTKVIFRGDPPEVGEEAFLWVGTDCTAYVRRGSIGWGVEIPGMWEGLNICYLTPAMEIAMANEAGNGTVEVDVEELGVDVEVASGVTLVAMGEELNADALAAKIMPKPHEDGQSASLFKVKAESVPGGVALAVGLDEDAVKPDKTAAEVVAVETVAAFSAAANGENVSVNLPSAKPGLYYGIAAAGDLAGLDAAAANVSLVRADEGGAMVPVVKPSGGAAFFKVIVSDRAR